MADKLQSSRYKPLNLKIPVLSKNYKSVLRDLKSKKDQIESEDTELNILKQDLIALKSKATSSTAHSTASCSRQAFSPEISFHRGKSNLRTTITTPKGTKRKVRPSRVHFQGSLKDILDVNVKEIEGQPLLSVDILLQRLYTRSSLKGIGSRELLYFKPGLALACI